MKNMINSVTGPLEPGKLGLTITHEHLFWDQACYAGDEPEEPSMREFIHQEIRMDNLGKVFFNAHRNLDNIRQSEIGLAVEEAMHFKNAGGSTIVDCTSIGIGRDPRKLLSVSEDTGLNVIMGSGYYISSSYPGYLWDMDKINIADTIIEEFAVGVENTGMKPGIIGEIGISDRIEKQELEVLKAAAIAQKETGAPLFIHPPFKPYAHELLDVVEKEGGDVSRVVICHCDPTLDRVDYQDTIAKRGAYLEYDQFGLEFPLSMEHGTFWLPRDIDRIRAIKKQIELGNLQRILVSQDVCFKTSLVKYGGWGYAHIIRDLAGYMEEEGITEAERNTVMRDNPERILTMV